jgi:ADP-ribose pyrophosphatase
VNQDRDPRDPGQEQAPLVDARRAAGIGRTKPGQIDSRTLHDGRIVHLAMDTARFPDGSTGELELIRHSGAAAVVPVLGDPGAHDPSIVLLRQFRYAAGGEMFEIPAGRPDRDGEPWDQVARRELEEETGYTATDLHPLTTIYTTPGFTDERIHLYLATGLTAGTTNLDRDEFVEVVTLPLSCVLAAVKEGRIIDGKSICALLYYASFSR